MKEIKQFLTEDELSTYVNHVMDRFVHLRTYEQIITAGDGTGCTLYIAEVSYDTHF